MDSPEMGYPEKVINLDIQNSSTVQFDDIMMIQWLNHDTCVQPKRCLYIHLKFQVSLCLARIARQTCSQWQPVLLQNGGYLMAFWNPSMLYLLIFNRPESSWKMFFLVFSCSKGSWVAKISIGRWCCDSISGEAKRHAPGVGRSGEGGRVDRKKTPKMMGRGCI